MIRYDANLVIRPEKLGDLVWVTPVFKAFKDAFPKQPLHLLTDEKSAEAVKYDPYVDLIRTIPWRGRNHGQRPSWMSMVRFLREYKYERAAIMYADCDGWNIALFLAGVPEVAQLGRTVSAYFFNHKTRPRNYYKDGKHFVEMYLDVSRMLGVSISYPVPELYLNQHEKDFFSNRFPEFSKSNQKVIIHPFSAGSAHTNFSIDSYMKLADSIVKNLSCTVYVVGTQKEEALWTYRTNPNIKIDLLGQLSLRELLVACSLANVVIGGSSGVVHTSAAFGTPTIGLYCPSVFESVVCRPIGKKVILLTAPPALCKNIKGCDPLNPKPGFCDISYGIQTETILTHIAKFI